MQTELKANQAGAQRTVRAPRSRSTAPLPGPATVSPTETLTPLPLVSLSERSDNQALPTADLQRMAVLEERLARLESQIAQAPPSSQQARPALQPTASTAVDGVKVTGKDAIGFGLLDKRIGNLEEGMAQVLTLLGKPRVDRKAYTTEEFAGLIDHSVWTVRRWCRERRVKASKRACGRGVEGEWAISHAEYERYLNEGLLPSKD